MTLVVLYRTAQTACNKPTPTQAFAFKDSATPTQAFSFDSRAISTGDTFGYYADNGKGQWERGLGTWDDTAKTITRTTFRESSTGSAIDWNYWGVAPTVWSDGRQKEDYRPSVIEIDFGASEANSVAYTIADTRITTSNVIIPSLAYYDTADHTAEEALCEGITLCASNVVDGVSYDIIAFAPNCTWGRYYINVQVI